MSDQPPPIGGPGGPEDDRPAPLIPSRAARHQKKGGLLRGRAAKAPKPSQPPPAPQRRERPERPDRRER
ncbi:MAG TPA: hypothetical protein VHA34_05440, partial [Actinomycetes bacterium]|nr:hypothetical protein [Actinomycetes bacterium]